MSKKLLLFFALLLSAWSAMAQVTIPPACGSGAEPAEDCASACISCDFNGYMGSTSGYSPSGAPFCPGFTINNDQWFGFIAGAASATFTVTPSNCTAGDGLQLAIYPAGCNDSPIACNGGCTGCGTTPQSVSTTMLPGSNYYLLIDGYGGDECDVTITVVPPIAVQANPLGPSGNLSGPNTICPGGTTTFTMPAVTNAGFYTWSSPTPGVLFNDVESPATFEAPGGRTVQVTVPSGYTGPVTICCEPASSCFTGTERCKTINVVPLPPTNLPKAVVCNEDAPYILPWGDEVMSTGNYSATFTSYQGCDSTVNQMVQILPKPITNLTRYVCTGDCVTICTEQYCDQGSYSETCDSYRMCDSTVNLTLNVLNPIANILGNTVLSCAVPSITLTSTASPNFPGVSVKVWRTLPANAVVGNGDNLTVTQPGTYYLTTTMSAGGIQCIKRDTVVITGNTTPPTAVGVNSVIGCASGSVQIGVTTNATNPTFAWSGNGLSSTLQNPFVSAGGVYTVTVTNGANGCTATATATVAGNTTPPVVTTVGALLNCNNPTQQISATSDVPSNFAWSGPASGSGPTLSVTAPGSYVVTVTSTVNGCSSVASANVTSDFAVPGAVASAAGTITCPTPTVTLNGSSPTTNATFSWSTGTNGATATAPMAGTYTVTVTGPNGCTATATATVTGNTNLPTATATGVTLSCGSPSQTINASSATPNVTYMWNIGGNTVNSNTAVVNTPGTYTVTVTAVNDCTQTAVATVNGDFAAPNASATGATINCGVNTVTINGNSTTSNVTYSWVGPGGTPYTGQSANVSVVGNYTLVVTAANGCTTTAVATVVPDANIPNVSAIGDTINCLSATATISGASTTPGVTFTWTYNNNPLPNPSNPTQSVTQNGLYTLTVVNPGNGCTAIATAFVTLDTNAPGASTQDAILTCASNSLDLTAVSPTNNVTYTWPGGANTQVLSVSAPGTYTVTVTGTNGCTSTAVAVVQADQGIPVLTTAASTLTCAQSVVTINTTSTVTADYAWTGPAGFAPTTNQNPQVSLPGTYTVLATNPANGCSSTATITVNQDIAAPNVAATGGVLTCANTALALSSTSTTPGATFSWPTLNTSNQNPTVSVSGTYIVEVTGLNGCVSTATATVTQNVEQPAIDIAAPVELTCAVVSSDLLTTIDPLSNTVQTVLWSDGSTTEDIAVAIPGTYTVTVTLSNGCTSTEVVTVSQDITPPAASALGGTLTCAVPTINLTGASTTAGATLAWSNGLPPTGSPSVSAAGTYVLTVTGPNGCTSTASALVDTDTNPPGASIATSNVITCAETAATLTASTTSGVSYDWSGTNVNMAATPTVVVQTAGTYTVIITAANGCSSTATFTQTDDLVSPDIAAVGDTIDCISGIANITGSSNTANVTYAWEGPNFNSTNPTPAVVAPGNYTLTVTAANGCSSSTTIEVAENTLSPNAEITNSTILLTCAVTSIDLTGSTTTPNTTIEWTLPNGSTSTTPLVAATEPGVYLFEVTSSTNGCVSNRSITISQNITAPGDLAVVDGTLDCSNPSITISGSSDVSNATYVWTGPGGEIYNQFDPSVSTAGVYTLLVTDPANGCTSTITATVGSSTDLPTIAVTAETLTCSDPSTVLDATTNVPNATFSWSGPQFTSPLQDPTTDKAGNYQVTVTDPGNGCTSVFSIEVIADQVAPDITVQNAQLSCQQPQVPLTGNSTTASVTYLWTGPGGETFTVPVPTVGQPGDYVLVVTNTVNGCTSSATASVAADQNIPVLNVVGGELTCAVVSLDLVATVNKTGVEWSWTGPGGFVSTVQNPTITAPGSYTATATTPINGCSGQFTIVIPQDIEAPVVNMATPDQLNCTVTQVNLQATVPNPGNYTFEWSTPSGTILAGNNSGTPTVSQAAIYAVVVTNTDNGCTTTRDVEVTVDEAVPSAIAHTPIDISCYGRTDGAVTIQGVTGGTEPYLFSIDNQPFVAAGAFNNLPPGTHSLQVQDANGCEFETVFTVIEPAELLVNLGPDTTISLGYEITIKVDSTNVSNPGSIATTLVTPAYLDTLIGAPFLPKYTLQYQLTAVDSNGCKATDTRVVIVDRTRHVYVPNSFNPNGSGDVNSLLRVFGGRDVELFKSFAIYDRWGEKVFVASDFAPNDGNVYWDGKFNNKAVDPAVYVWVVEVTFKDGETELFSGDVAVTR